MYSIEEGNSKNLEANLMLGIDTFYVLLHISHISKIKTRHLSSYSISKHLHS
jgi:hypothetical protein